MASPEKVARMVCKKCSDLFEPETYREKMTGTCSKDECYVPFADDSGRKYHMKDIKKYSFRCLRCSADIFTNDVSERFCEQCRVRNKSVSSRYYI